MPKIKFATTAGGSKFYPISVANAIVVLLDNNQQMKLSEYLASIDGGKADKVSGATNGNFAGLDGNGNLLDSGKKPADFATAAQGSKADSAVQSVKIGTDATEYNNSGNVVLPAYPTTLPASDVYEWAKQATKPSYTASEVGAIASTLQGAANGVAELDGNGKVPASQLPSYVDDVIDGYKTTAPTSTAFANDTAYAVGAFVTYDSKLWRFKTAHAAGDWNADEVEEIVQFPVTGEVGKIYVDVNDNTTWRWSGTQYVQIKGDLAIGTTTGTAADGGTVNTHINDTDIHVTANDKVAWGAKYDLPSGGIPKTDLASAVQTSLGKADTAVQCADVADTTEYPDVTSLFTAPAGN